MRKSAGLNIDDRIRITYESQGNLTTIMENTNLSEYIKTETLATHLVKGEPSKSNYSETISLNKSDIKIGISTLI